MNSDSRSNFFGITFILALTLTLLTFSIGCGDGGGGGEVSVLEAEKEINESGGTVAVNDVQSDLYGTKIVVPEGALDDSTIITIKKVSGPLELDEDSQGAGLQIDFGPDGTTFNKEVFITIPYIDNDNDGIVDGTDVTEDYVRVVTYDTELSRWLYEKVESIDRINNTITISANHFCIKAPSVIHGDPGRDDVDIFTIDGLRFTKIAWPFNDDDMRPAYLRPAIRFGMSDLNLNHWNVYSYGNNQGESWSGDANYTHEELPKLIRVLNSRYNIAKQPGNEKKFVLVTHSWGTVLGALALSFSPDVKPDLFITLSSPIGSHFNHQYLHDPFFIDNPADIAEVEEIQVDIQEYIVEQKSKIRDSMGSWPYFFGNGFVDLPDKRWLNYWAMGDVISGPLRTFSPNIQDIRIGDSEKRNYSNMKLYHAITSLDARGLDYSIYDDNNELIEGKWKKYLSDNSLLLNKARNLRDEIKNQICATLDNIGDGCSSSPYTIWYKDFDGDGYTVGTIQVEVNRPSINYYKESELTSIEEFDDDDMDPTVYPGAPEICDDDKDNDQDGEKDEGCEQTVNSNFYGNFEYSLSGTEPNSCQFVIDEYIVGDNYSKLDGSCNYLYIPPDSNDNTYSFNDCDGDNVERTITVSGNSIHWVETGDCSGVVSPCWTYDLVINFNSSFDGGTVTGTRYDEDPNICQGAISGTFSKEGALDDAIYSTVSGHWYNFNNIKMTWTDAEAFAKSQGGYLATMTSAEENKWISDNFTIQSGSLPWLGGNDIQTEGQWDWITGEVWSYSNWYYGEPNNMYPEDCVKFHPYYRSGHGNYWNDSKCDSEQFSLIEYDSDPN